MTTIPLIAERTFNTTPERLWLLITDSDLFTRTIGFPPVNPELTRDEDGLNRTGAPLKMFGVKIGRMHDPSIEWVKPVWFSRRRVISAGPMREVFVRIELTPYDNSTKVRIEMVMSVPFGRGWMVRMMMQLIRKRVNKFFNKVENSLTAIYSGLRIGERRSRTNETYLDAALSRMKVYHIDPDLLSKARQWLIDEADVNLKRIKPLEFADRMRIDQLSAIRFFLIGATEGLFDLHWDLICPNCRGVTNTYNDLKSIQPEDHCDVCRIDLKTNFDESIEANFAPTHNLRPIKHVDYCYGYPALTSHVEVQLRLEADGKREIDHPLSGTHNLWAMPFLHRDSVSMEDDRGHEICVSETEIEVLDNDLNRQLSVANLSPKPVMFQIQSPLYNPNMLTASKLTALQDFRDFFATQLLDPSVSLAVKHLTFLFSDLKSSTEMYSHMGDTPAFALVKDHFDIMRKIIREHEGGIVKTIGDAVMALFSDPVQAIATAIEIQNAFATNPLTIKIGLHNGPCISIMLNDNLDYFGTTVNTAARVESISQGGDIVLTCKLFDLPGVKDEIRRRNVIASEDSAELKGLTEQVQLVRLKSRNWT